MECSHSGILNSFTELFFVEYEKNHLPKKKMTYRIEKRDFRKHEEQRNSILLIFTYYL